MVTPEARPFKTTGGLADVAGALPQALARLGHRVTLVMPRYRGVDIAGASSQPANVPFGPNLYPVTFHIGSPESRPAGAESTAVSTAKSASRTSSTSARGSRELSSPV